MTYEDLEDDLYNSQEWTSFKGKSYKNEYFIEYQIFYYLIFVLDTSKLEKLVNRINLNEDYSTTLLNPKLDKDK